jgi:inner membrane protein
LIPDIDTHQSKIAHSAGFATEAVSGVIESVAGHRGVFHSAFGAVALFLLARFAVAHYHLPYVYVLYELLSFMFFGYISHLILDTPTGGVPWLYPFSKKRFGLYLKTDGFTERTVFFPVILICDVYLIVPLIFDVGRRMM